MTFEKLSVGEVTIEEVSIVGVLAGENVRPENAWTQVKPALDEKTPQNFAKFIFPLTKNKYIQDFIILLKNKTERLICRKSATTINLMCKKY